MQRDTMIARAKSSDLLQASLGPRPRLTRRSSPGNQGSDRNFVEVRILCSFL